MSALSSEINTTAFTIVTPNYLAYAFALRKSFLQFNSESNFVICLVGYKEHVPAFKNYDFVFLNQLSDERITGMIKRYSPFELSCALKPFFAKHIFEKIADVDRLIYLDGDMHVFGKFTQQSDAAITLSPHRTIRVNYLPGLDNFSTIDLLRYGVYNAGYFELLRRQEAFAFIIWWQELMENHAYFKPDEHIFTDQLWLSAVHSFFDDVFVNKNPGYNVGFWNLIERTVVKRDGIFYANNEPLVLFHFSNYKVEQPELLINFKDPMLNFENLPELKFIFEQYRNSILAENYEELKHLPYPFQYKKSQSKKKWWQKIAK